MLRLFLVFSAISIIVCGSTFIILKRRLGLSKTENLALGVFLALIGVLIVVGPLVFRFGPMNTRNPINEILQYTQYFLMGWVGVNFLVLLAFEIIQQLAKPFDPAKRIFLSQGLMRGVVAASTTSIFAGLWEANLKPKIYEVPIKLPTLPKAFDGLTIAQISDIHIGPLLHKQFLDGVVDQVMSLNADMIFITGDLVDGTVEQLKDQIEPLKRLKAREGIYFCTGNHEFYSGVAEWIDHLESIGIHVFKNSNRVLTRKNAQGMDEKLLIAGVHDWHGDQFSKEYISDPEAAAKTIENVSCKILLAHNPYSIDGAAAAGFNLQISGHTHAGQFYPFVFLVKLKLKHSEGWYRINDQTQLYVNRGTGYWGPPNRLGVRSEISYFTLS